MLFVFANFWGWILAALVLGSFVGWVTWSYEQRESWLRTWLRWWGLAFVIGLLLVLFKALPGRAGLYLETAIWLFAVYIVGCFVGGWLRAAFGSEPVTVSGKSKLVDQLPARVAPSQAVSARVAATYSDGQRPQKSVASHDKDSMVPKKMWPRGDVSEWTSPPSPHARDGKEGPKRGHQADKSSKSK